MNPNDPVDFLGELAAQCELRASSPAATAEERRREAMRAEAYRQEQERLIAGCTIEESCRATLADQAEQIAPRITGLGYDKNGNWAEPRGEPNRAPFPLANVLFDPEFHLKDLIKSFGRCIMWTAILSAEFIAFAIIALWMLKH